MNKLLLSSALAVAFGAAALAPQAAHASDGTITFNGKVTASTCTVSVNGGGASNGVTLPTVATSALTGAIGTVAAATPFSVSLSACTFTPVGTVGLYFEPGPNTKTNGNLKNTAASNGVDSQLLNSSRGVMTLNSAPGSQNGSTATVATGDTSATLSYYAQYYANAATVTPGTVTSTVTYSVVYP